MPEVFLGGSCNPTTWRHKISIPILKKNEITFFNPQVDEWNENLIDAENHAKETANILFFVIDGETRAIASMLEVTELICQNRKMILVINQIKDKQLIDNKEITDRELKDLNRGRIYLEDMAIRYNIPLFQNITEATNHIMTLLT